MKLESEKELFYLLYVFDLHETLMIRDQGMYDAMRPVPKHFLTKILSERKRKGL